MLTFHAGPGVVECCCGQIITGNHLCIQLITEQRIRVRKCRFKELTNNECSICQADSEQKLFAHQWYTDIDGYDRCSECSCKCTYGQLPKECECDDSH